MINKANIINDFIYFFIDIIEKHFIQKNSLHPERRKAYAENSQNLTYQFDPDVTKTIKSIKIY